MACNSKLTRVSVLLAYLGADTKALTPLGLRGRKMLTTAQVERVIEAVRRSQGDAIVAEAMEAYAERLREARKG